MTWRKRNNEREEGRLVTEEDKTEEEESHTSTNSANRA